MKQNKIDRLKINYKYVFIKCLNENDMLISANKFGKDQLLIIFLIKMKHVVVQGLGLLGQF